MSRDHLCETILVDRLVDSHGLALVRHQDAENTQRLRFWEKHDDCLFGGAMQITTTASVSAGHRFERGCGGRASTRSAAGGRKPRKQAEVKGTGGKVAGAFTRRCLVCVTTNFIRERDLSLLTSALMRNQG